MNIVILTGNVGNEPEIQHFEGGDKQATVSLATTKRWKDRESGEKKEKTQWHRLIMNKGLADVVESWVHSGDKLAIQGELRYRDYDGENGKVYVTEVYVTNMEMIGSKKGSGEHPNEQPVADGKEAKTPAAKKAAEKKPAAKKTAAAKKPAEGEDDLPF